MSVKPANSPDDTSAADQDSPAAEVVGESTRTSAIQSVEAPRPPLPEDIAKMMSEAEARAQTGAAPATSASSLGFNFETVLTAVLWLGVGFAGLAAALVIAQGQSPYGLVIAGAAMMVIVAFVVSTLAGWISPARLVSSRKSYARGDYEAKAILGGTDVLAELGITEKILDTAPDAILVTQRSGVVVYANSSYLDVARAAGLLGATGLPPRIDRLFGQHGSEASKVFRLCKAAKGGEFAEEALYQSLVAGPAHERRCFNVSVRPVDGSDQFVCWRLQELPAEDDQKDVLASSYADFVSPVLALSRAGAIVWTNAAMRKLRGKDDSAVTTATLDELILGDAEDLCHRLWLVDQEPIDALIRRPGLDPLSAKFRAFRRGGQGEGFVCVAIDPEAEEESDAPVKVAGDVTDAPFGVAVVEGELGSDAKVTEANSAFISAFEGAKKGTPLSKVLNDDIVAEISKELKKKSVNALKSIDVTKGEGPAAQTYAVFARQIKRRRGSYGKRKTFLYTVDVTDRKRMEADYAQDQKLKAIGFIAGEVAHDFNNLLQVVLSSSEDLMRRHPAGDPAYEDLVLIRQNSQRAANLTKQLLAYSRKQTLTSKPESITDLLLDFSRFLDRAVGENVRLKLVNGRGLPLVKVDGNQLETALMNLAVNARDAMAPAGGILTIETRPISREEITSDPELHNHPGIEEADYVAIEVRDTGPGIPKDIAEKIFEPFFTTKEEGKGTGLGLSTVHGIIGQMGGVITVKNGETAGAVFTVYLPAHDGSSDAQEETAEADAAAETDGAKAEPAADYNKGGRILVVEDEDAVRFVVVKALKQAGYTIEVADDGVEALEILEHDIDFDLVVTDVMMPEVDGPSMIDQARREHDLKAGVLFMSGYAESAIRTQLDKVDSAHYLQKPFSMVDLNNRVKTALYEHDQATAS